MKKKITSYTITLFKILIPVIVVLYMFNINNKYNKNEVPVEFERLVYIEAPYEIRKTEEEKRQQFTDNAIVVILKHHPKMEKFTAEKIANSVYKYSQIFHYDPYFILSVLKIESGYNPKAVSQVGAMGLMQLMPLVGLELAEMRGHDIKSTKELFNIDLNIELGVYYLKYLHKKYNNVKIALLAYNMGPGNMNYFLRHKKWPENDYDIMVLSYYKKVRQ